LLAYFTGYFPQSSFSDIAETSLFGYQNIIAAKFLDKACERCSSVCKRVDGHKSAHVISDATNQRLERYRKHQPAVLPAHLITDAGQLKERLAADSDCWTTWTLDESVR